MLRGLDHVNRSVRILVGRNATLPQRLYEAAKEFSVALPDAGQWPGDLPKMALRIDAKLTSRGSIDRTVNGMDTALAGETAEAMLELAILLSASDALRHPGGSVPLPSPRSGRR